VDSVETFAVEARLFERWLLEGVDQQGDAARGALTRLLALYRAALDLPPAWSDETKEANEPTPVSDVDWQRAYHAAGRVPIDLYSEVHNPTEVPAEESGVGSVADDLADIYRDVCSGLRAYDNGDRAAAVWEWSFGLHTHWGAHATGAIRALHWWLVENAIDKLSVGPTQQG
jgi:hypothetical protein